MTSSVKPNESALLTALVDSLTRDIEMLSYVVS
jgi:hypothetical protein